MYMTIIIYYHDDKHVHTCTYNFIILGTSEIRLLPHRFDSAVNSYCRMSKWEGQMATKATERLETDAVSQSRSERVERLSRTRTSSGTGTKEYRAIKRHSATIIEILGSTVGDPARFARRLRVESLVTDGKYSAIIYTRRCVLAKVKAG